METIGQRIRRERKKLGFDVPALAKHAGLKPSTIYDIENGHQESSTKLHLIAEKLGVSVKWLETGKGDPHVKDSATPPQISSAVAWGFDLTQEAAELGWQWSLLPDDQRNAIHTLIYALVGKSKRKQPARADVARAPTGVHDSPGTYKPA